jgi:hypothetical protein
MTGPNVDPAAIPDVPIAVGTPAAEAQEHPPVSALGINAAHGSPLYPPPTPKQ